MELLIKSVMLIAFTGVLWKSCFEFCELFRGTFYRKPLSESFWIYVAARYTLASSERHGFLCFVKTMFFFYV